MVVVVVIVGRKNRGKHQPLQPAIHRDQDGEFARFGIVRIILPPSLFF